MKKLWLALPFVIAACDGGNNVTQPGKRIVPPTAANFSENESNSDAKTIVVSPANMHGWAFFNDATDAPCADTSCQMVVGPGDPPLGIGSAEMTLAGADRRALILYSDYKGTRFDSFTALKYSTYRQSADVGNILAIALQFNVDYDLNDATTTYQGRLVFEPYQSGFTVPQNTWQTWDALAGKWWGSRATVTKNNLVVPNPCVQASPCTRAALLLAFPNIGVLGSFGGVVLKAGGPWPGFKGNVDNLTIGVNGATTTFDFEPARRERDDGDCKRGGSDSARPGEGVKSNGDRGCNHDGTDR